MLGFLATIAALLTVCFGIGVEYYDDKNLPEVQAEDVLHMIPYTRQTGNENISEISNVWKQNVSDVSNTSTTPKYNIRRDNFYHSTLLDRNYRTTLSNLSIIHNSTMFVNSTIKRFPSDTLQEYDYLYDDDAKPYLLRQNLQKPGPNLQTNVSVSNVKVPLTEFYNLEPAVQLLNFNVQHQYSNCYNLWYVLEDLPCWELPVLYGEFGSQKKASEVFLMHGGELKNVIEKKYEEKRYETHNIDNIPLYYYTNKWCKASPCYGDHTLCLFSDQTYSGICNIGYKVDVPSISEQTALVSILNSMRNKIANGESDRYSHLPTAANMNQIIYDLDLENFAKVWLLQCLPGPEPCSALDETFVTQLECTKFAKFCCVNSFSSQYKKCTPKPECFTPPIIGCLHVWFWSAGTNLTLRDIQCGHTSALTYSTAQILWAATYKIGCAYARNSNGDVRVICNFSPGAPYALNAKYYCGILNLKGGEKLSSENNISDTSFLKSFGIDINNIIEKNQTNEMKQSRSESLKLVFDEETNIFWGIEILQKIYSEGLVRTALKDFTNGTRDMIARLVVKYSYVELNGAKCDSEEPVYAIGPPGSLCVERGRRYQSLCYNYRDPTPEYRFVAVIAPIALFSLILYDLFSGIVRQTNY